MRKVLILAAFAALGFFGLSGAVALLWPQPGSRPELATHDIRPVWTEVKWPFPIDQWGTGKAFACRAADCGVELTLFLRAKIGFCNCQTGVADDEELERVSDLELVGQKFSALGPGRSVVAAASMKGRSRRYAIEGAARAPASAVAVALNDRCDVVVATAFVLSRAPDAWEPAVMAFLNTDGVRQWAEKTLGL